MGEVYRARDSRLGRDVAIKIISHRGARDPESVNRFEQEAKAVAAVSHPNILAIHDFGNENGISFAVMELLRGESLDDRLAREHLSWRKAVEIAAAVTDGLAAAHARRIIHRDLKPANIFLTADGQVKILDFGLAKLQAPVGDAFSRVETESQPNLVVGTIGYMSPEQVTGAAVDARSDIFALGCILYEMISGQRAFRRLSAGETLAAILRDNPADLSESSQRFPSAIANVVRRCLQKNPDERFQSARDLGFALREILNTSETGGRPRPWIAYTAMATIAAVLLAAVWFALRSGHLQMRPAGIRSLAVLPLTNLSGDPGQEYLADGMTEQLISDLARIGDVRVTSLTSSMSTKGTKKTLPQIARELGVEGVVEGTIVRSGDRIKVTAELIDADSDKHLWTDTYERDLKDIVSVQREIARAVARNIHVELSPEARSRLEEERSIDPRSFDAFIRGRYALNNADNRRALEQFKQALDSDPTNADAYAGLADTYARMGYSNDLSPADSFPKAKAAASRALEIDRNSADAHATLAYVHMYYDWDFPAADAEFRNAIALNPSLASAHHYYSVYLAAMLRPAEANREAAIARTLDPLSVPVATDSGFVMYYDRDYDKATKILEDAIAMNPKAPLPHFWLGRVYQAQKRYTDATAEYNAGLPGISKSPPVLAGLGHMYAVTGRHADALKILHQIESTQGYVTPYAAALIYLGLEEKEKTLALLDRCVDERTNWLVWLLKDPRWDPMRSDPRFQAIIRKIGFPAEAQARQPHA
jgi:eukaryotic-like serine/threonine-protein kinase